jgi:hypothetical protein
MAPKQYSPAAQDIEQPPQLSGFFWMLMQTPPHAVVPREQAQLPFTQLPPPPHAIPHAPQFAGSRVTSTQLPAQATVPVGQTLVHAPAPQTWPAGHVIPHDPQWLGSVAVDTQTPPHSCVPAGQAHAPSTQLVPPVQAMPHPPQFPSSAVVFTQAPLQAA